MFHLFGENEINEKLSTLGDPLEKLSRSVDFETFRPLLHELLFKTPKGHGGRKPYDYVLMFKILIVQRYYNLSDDQMEYQMLDRYSFRRFFGFSESSISMPDAKTIWHFRNELSKHPRQKELFGCFFHALQEQRVISKTGTMIDASFIEAPKQRNPKGENTEIKEGNTPKNWSESKKRQKDVHATWTQKGGQRYYGYKNHVSVDLASKLVTNFEITPAHVHDSSIFDVLLSDDDKIVYADSAYLTSATSKEINRQICERAYRNRPLTDAQKAMNREKSKKCSRVEHVFGFIQNSMNGSTIRSIGFVRAAFNTTLTNLTYNLFRFEQIRRLNLIS